MVPYNQPFERKQEDNLTKSESHDTNLVMQKQTDESATHNNQTSASYTALSIPEPVFSSPYIQPVNPTAFQAHYQTFKARVFISFISKNRECIQSNVCLLFIVSKLIPAVHFCFDLVVAVVITIALTPLLLVGFLFARSLQLIWPSSEEFGKAILANKIQLRSMLYLSMQYLLIAVGVLSGIVTRSRRLKTVTLLDLSIQNWIHTYCVIFGLFHVSCVISFTLYRYVTPKIPLSHRRNGVDVIEGIVEIMDCFIFWWMEFEVMRRVPSFKHHKILGLYTRKWIETSLFLCIAFNVITLSIHTLVFYIWKIRSGTMKLRLMRLCRSTILLNFKLFSDSLINGRYLVYYAYGLKYSINFVLSSLLLLLVWVFYFGYQLSPTPLTQKVVAYGKWSCFTILICSILWLIKTCVLLSWETNSIYRLDSKIVKNAKQLYLLVIIACNRLNLNSETQIKTDSHGSIDNFENVFFTLLVTITVPSIMVDDKLFRIVRVSQSKREYIMDLSGEELSTEQKHLVKDDLWSRITVEATTMYDIQHMASYFLAAKDYVSTKKYTSHILQDLKRLTLNRSLREYLIEVITEGKHIDDETWQEFENQNLSEHQEIPFGSFEIWMEKARNNCLLLANTISSGKEVVDCLNKIITCIITVVLFIMWLLITGLASTKVLVIVASPLLAATFIFGDSCKTMFQGIMFAYVVHLFDVGDLCRIDGVLMEVKTVGIWRTTFSKVSTQEEVVYSNSDLSNKNCINYKTEFDWNDSLEFDASPLDKAKFTNVKEKIEGYLKNHKDENGEIKYRQGYNSVEVLTTKENVKIVVNLRHDVKSRLDTNLESLLEKRHRRSEFVIYVHNLLDQNKYEESKTSNLDQNAKKGPNASDK